VADGDAAAQALQAAHRVAIRGVGARHLEAEIDEDLGDPAHAGSADADEMDLLDVVEHAPSSPQPQVRL